MVVIDVPPACSAGTRQLFTRSPFTITEHAPHSPSPQPSLTPVRWRSSRRISSSRAIAYVSTSWGSPFTRNRTRTRSGIEHFHQIFGQERDMVYGTPNGVFDSV